jgi:hypothetical protein
MSGAFVGQFQIPDVAGQEPLGDFGSPTLASSSLNENETDRFFFGVLALQTHYDQVDTQRSAFTRYATTHFVPDLDGDLAFNDVASNVVRKSVRNGVQFDISDRLSEAHTLRVDAYYKRSTDTIDDGQFGQAVVLNLFNYADGFSRGAELKFNYSAGGSRSYANLSYEITMVKDVVSNQYLIGDPVELAYLATTYTYASDAQTVTASTGASYRWHGVLASIDGMYGSGLRAGFANE